MSDPLAVPSVPISSCAAFSKFGCKAYATIRIMRVDSARLEIDLGVAPSRPGEWVLSRHHLGTVRGRNAWAENRHSYSATRSFLGGFRRLFQGFLKLYRVWQIH